MRRKKSNNIVAAGGILTALNVLALYFASFGVGPNMCFYLLCSLFICVMIHEYGVNAGIIIFVASGILGFLLMPDKFGIVAYGVGFGIYPIVKFFAEKSRGAVGMYIIKILWILTAVAVYYWITKTLFISKSDNFGHSLIFVGITSVVMFFIYDYILTILIGLYDIRVRRRNR